MAQREVVVLSGVRTAIGDYGGSLKDVAPTSLGATVVREAVIRASAALICWRARRRASSACGRSSTATGEVQKK